MQVCLSGHQITSMADSHPEHKRKNCPKCGASTITQCPACKANIPGYHHIPSVIRIGSTKVPAFCQECGKPYPWTSRNQGAAVTTGKKSKKKSVSMTVFVVHGHDEEMKQAAARVLSVLGLKPIVLHEQPNQGKTLIDKFEKNADVGFAVVLLSPDDMAYPKSSPTSKARPRARQNVVMELGYFIGSLGREHVFTLKRGDLELPSDVSGVAYTTYDESGSWRLELVRELKAAGYTVDANSLLS